MKAQRKTENNYSLINTTMTKLEMALALLPMVEKVQESGIYCGIQYDIQSVDFWFYDKFGIMQIKTVNNDKTYQQCIHLINSQL